MHVTFDDDVKGGAERQRGYGSTEGDETRAFHRRATPPRASLGGRLSLTAAAFRRGLTVDFGRFAYSSSVGDIDKFAIYFLIYIVTAIIAYSFVFEKWSIVNSVYFAITLFTTTGFGDLSPHTEGGRIFTTFFDFLGIIIIGLLVGMIAYAIGNAQQKEMKQIKEESRATMLNNMFPNYVEKTQGDRAPLSDTRITVLSDLKEVVCKSFPWLLAVVVLALILGILEGWPVTTSLYFCIIMSTTTGLGDVVPTTTWTKFYCILYIPFAVIVFAETVGNIASAYIRRKNRLVEQRFLRRSMTLSDLRTMDVDADGTVSMEEFLVFMLVALQKVDREAIDELKGVFRAIDKSRTGRIDKEDLISHAWQVEDWDDSDTSHEDDEGKRPLNDSSKEKTNTFV